MKFCDSCLDAIYELDRKLSPREAKRFLADFGADIPDHNCDAIDEPDLAQCHCPGHE